MTIERFKDKNIAVIGAGGALGAAFIEALKEEAAHIHAFSRSAADYNSEHISSHKLDVHNETELERAALLASQNGPLDMVIVAIGTLHGAGYQPEKSYREFDATAFETLFKVNTIAPALIAKHFLPIMDKNGESIFAAISARIGSTSDNRIGGWTSYRASKAALNMVIKNLSIEQARKNKQCIIVGLHPGTVDTELSKPYQAGVPAEKLFTPQYSAQKMLDVLSTLTPDCTGKCYAWDGGEIAP